MRYSVEIIENEGNLRRDRSGAFWRSTRFANISTIPVPFSMANQSLQDYSLRAKDYNEKKRRLQILHQKAADRNPDEFHFEMLSSKSHDRGQKLQNRGNAVLSQDAVKLFKTQDASYLKTMVQKTRKARERLEREFTIDDGDMGICGGESGHVQDRHMYFVNTVEEQKQFDAKGFPRSKRTESGPAYDLFIMEQDDLIDTEEKMDNGPSQLRTLGKVSISDRDPKEDSLALRNDSVLRKLRKRGKEARASQLTLLRLRERELLTAEQELELQRAKMSNSVGGMNKTGVKWRRRERKK